MKVVLLLAVVVLALSGLTGVDKWSESQCRDRNAAARLHNPNPLAQVPVETCDGFLPW